MTTNDIDAIRKGWLVQCGPCDFGVITMGCACPDGDYRSVVSALCKEVEQLRAELEHRRVEVEELRWALAGPTESEATR